MTRETRIQSPVVFDATLINTQHYKVRIKGKVELSRERSMPSSPLYLGVLANEKRACNRKKLVFLSGM